MVLTYQYQYYVINSMTTRKTTRKTTTTTTMMMATITTMTTITTTMKTTMIDRSIDWFAFRIMFHRDFRSYRDRRWSRLFKREIKKKPIDAEDARPLTVALRLPDGVTDSPERRYDEEDRNEVLIGNPVQQEYHDSQMEDASDADDRFPGDVLGDEADEHREDRVGHSERDHVVSDEFHADLARYVGLHRTNKTTTYTLHIRFPFMAPLDFYLRDILNGNHYGIKREGGGWNMRLRLYPV